MKSLKSGRKVRRLHSFGRIVVGARQTLVSADGCERVRGEVKRIVDVSDAVFAWVKGRDGLQSVRVA